jgi:hypothetical protein
MVVSRQSASSLHSLKANSIVQRSYLEKAMSLIREKPRTISGRSLEVTRTYLQRGQAVSRLLWIRVSPKHTLSKIIIALPIAVLMLTMLILFLIMLGFTLLAIALMGAISRGGAKDTEDG